MTTPTLTALSQWVSVPDSEYVAGELVVWFRPGVLNYEYFGCTSDGDTTEASAEFPVDTDFIQDENFVSFLESIGTTGLARVVPGLNPCRDTLSISRSGDTIPIPDFWNMLLVEFSNDGGDYDVPNMAIHMTLMYQNVLKIAEPNYVVRYPGQADLPVLQKSVFNEPNDSDLHYGQYNIKQWDPANYRYGTQVYAHLGTPPFAWERTQGSGNILVGIVDDGIDERHQDFGNQGEAVIGGYNYYIPNTSYTDYSWHGTRAAGIVGALTNNDYGIAGIAGGTGTGSNDNVKLVALKNGDGLDSPGKGTTTASIGGIVNGATALVGGSPGQNGWGCNILNMSWVDNKRPSEQLRSAIAYAYNNDVINICAMGNYQPLPKTLDYDRPWYPAGCDDQWVIAVGGSSDDKLAYGSTDGVPMDILAPIGNRTVGANFTQQGGVTYMEATGASGTSFAAPHVSGIAALLLSYREKLDNQNAPVPSYLAMEDVLMLMAEGASVPPYPHQIGLPLEKASDFGYGIVHAENALSRLASPYNLDHITVELVVEPTNGIPEMAPIAFPTKQRALNSQLVDNPYELMKYRLQTYVSFPQKYYHAKRVWNRGAKTLGAYPDIRYIENEQSGTVNIVPLPLYRNAGWAKVLEFNASVAKIETYLYKYRDVGSNNPWQWLDIDPNDNKITIALTILSDSNYTVSVEGVEPYGFEIAEIYPNPISSSVQSISIGVAASSRRTVNVGLFDALGRVVPLQKREYELLPGNQALLLGNLSLQTGVYFVRIADGASIKSRKLIVVQ